MDLSTANIFKILGSVTLFLLLIWFIYSASEPLLWIAAAFLIALLLNPIVGRFQKFMPRKNRIAAILLTVVIIFALLVFAILVTLRPLTQQFGDIIGNYSSQLNQLKESNQTLSDFLKQASASPTAYKETVSNIVSIIASFTISLINIGWAIITIIILAIFMLIRPKEIVDTVISYIPKKHQKLVKTLSDHMSYIVPRYFGGLLVTAFIIAVFTYIPLRILGIPNALALATSMLFFDLIPLVGATLGYVFIVGYCLLLGNTTAAVILIIYILIYQLFENNVIVPLIQQKSVKISPLSVLIAILIGSSVFGMIGALLAIPAAAMLGITYRTLVEEGYLKASK